MLFRRIHRITFSDAFKNYEQRVLASECLSGSPSVFSAVFPHGTTLFPLSGFSLNWYLRIFRKSVEEIQASLISDKNTCVLR
jgi:hypothetical protein